MSIAAIVLAAGFSRRLGRPKQTVVIAGETLVERVARVAREAGFHPVLVIVNTELMDIPAFPLERLRATGCDVLQNREAAEGMASSIRCGVGALARLEIPGVVLMTCDQVLLTATHLGALVREPEKVCSSGYKGRVGVPAYFPRNTFRELLALRGDQGARELLCDAQAVIAEDLALDVDAEEQLHEAERRLGSVRGTEGTLPED